MIDPVARKNSQLCKGEVQLDFTVPEKHSYKKGKTARKDEKNKKEEKGGFIKISNKIQKNQVQQQRQNERKENKMINDHELSVSHRWINLASNSAIISNKYSVDSIELVDNNMAYLSLNISRKFILSKEGYLVPEIDEFCSSEQVKNKWGSKFREVDKIMAWLCYDQNCYKNDQGITKEYTVCYEDRFLGLLETEF
jgi:hypothetical protein